MATTVFFILTMVLFVLWQDEKRYRKNQAYNFQKRQNRSR